MALANVLLLSQVTGHVILIILSLCIIVPMSLNLHDFCGHCLLFTTGKWREADGMFVAHWSSRGFCIFPLFTGVFVFVVSVGQIYRYTTKKDDDSFLVLFVDVVLGIWCLTMSILSAIMITLGFIVWCDNMTERFPTCEMIAGQNIIHGDVDHIDTSGFYMEMGTSQFGAWGAFAFCVGITVIALLKLIDNHQVRNIKVSMYLERQRLVNQHNLQNDGISEPIVATNANTNSTNNK